MKVDVSKLKTTQMMVVESSRRLQREQSYGYIHSFWSIWLEDRRRAASVPPGAGPAVKRILDTVDSSQRLLDSDIVEQLRVPVDAAIIQAGLEPTDRVLCDIVFACNASLLQQHEHGDCRQLMDQKIPPVEEFHLPSHCFPDGIVYGVIADRKVVSFAFAHRSGVLEDKVADLGVETASAYRRRGYAKTAVSAVVEHIARGNGEARYGCRPDNHASIATARSVGFVPYGTSMILSSPPLDLPG